MECGCLLKQKETESEAIADEVVGVFLVVDGVRSDCGRSGRSDGKVSEFFWSFFECIGVVGVFGFRVFGYIV